MTKQLAMWDVAWAAGFFDGEGCVSLARKVSPRGRPYFNLELAVSQVNPAPLLRMAELFGGRCHLSSYADGTAAYHRRGLYKWRIQSRKAIAALQAMLPYLIGKRDDALVGLEFALIQRPKKGGRPLTEAELAQRADLKARLTVLKRRVYADAR